MAATRVRRPVYWFGRGDAALRTASPAEADRSPPHEGPVSSVGFILSLRADGSRLTREGGTI